MRSTSKRLQAASGRESIGRSLAEIASDINALAMAATPAMHATNDARIDIAIADARRAAEAFYLASLDIRNGITQVTIPRLADVQPTLPFEAEPSPPDQPAGTTIPSPGAVLGALANTFRPIVPDDAETAPIEPQSVPVEAGTPAVEEPPATEAEPPAEAKPDKPKRSRAKGKPGPEKGAE